MLYCDIDGVLAKYTKSACKLLNIEESTWTNWGSPVGDKKMWAAIDKAGEQFWENLEPSEHFNQLTSLTDDFVLLTSPGKHPTCASGKTKWIQKHFGKNFRRYIICAAPKYHCCNPGDMLIDDSDKNCELWDKSGGISVKWPQPWNSAVIDKETTIKELKAYLDEKAR